MALTPEETRELFLSCTVQFPGSFPDLACISFDGAGVVIKAGSLALPRLVVVERRHDIFVELSMLFCDVTAVFFPQDVANVDLDAGVWLVGPQIQDAQQAQANLAAAKTAVQQDNPDGLGIVFVAEDAQVFHHLGVAAKASESCDMTDRLHFRNGSCGGYHAKNGSCGG